MRTRLLLVVVALPCLLWALLPLTSSGAPKQSLGDVQSKIRKKESAVSTKRKRERVLSVDVQSYSRRINRVQHDISGLQRRQDTLQSDLDGKRAELVKVQQRLRDERARLARLRARLAEGRRVLAARLVELYKADAPDMVSVVLQSNGFTDLVERSELLARIGQQDHRVIERVKRARVDAQATAKRLDRLEERQQRITTAVLQRRNEVASVKGKLVDRRDGYSVLQGRKQRALASVREARNHMEGDLKVLRSVENKILARLRQTSNPSSPGTNPPIRPGTGNMNWPVNGEVVSPFGSRWGRAHEGIDIAAPAGTPIHAVDDGTVALQQGTGASGGYGNFTCIQHSGSLATCYAHQSRFAVGSGEHVSKGQVIGYVGCTGHCYGDHLHFETRVNGSAVDPMGYL